MTSSNERREVCPACSPMRKPENQKDKDLCVNTETGAFMCMHCGAKGTRRVNPNAEIYYAAKKLAEAQPIKVERVNNTSLPDSVLDYFVARGITSHTVVRNKVFADTKYVPDKDGKAAVIGFPSMKDDKVFFVNYRTRDKKFVAEKGGTPTFFGLNDIVNSKECIICEGQIDKLSFEEVGYLNCVSVPNGVTLSDVERKEYEQTGKFNPNNTVNLDYLDRDWRYFEDKEVIYLATDTDAPGLKLREELARRLGKERCHIIEFPSGCKDANDVLTKLGTDTLRSCVKKAQPYPLEGILTVGDLEDDINRLYKYGMPKGAKVGYEKFDDLASFARGELTVVTGSPNAGKSAFTNQLAVRLAALNGWKFAVFSAENQPYEVFFAEVCEQYIGKPFYASEGRVTPEELEKAKKFFHEHFFFIKIETNLLSMDVILERVKQLIRQKGIHAVIIDPYTALESNMPAFKREDQYLKDCLNKLRITRKLYDIHVFIVAHPKTLDTVDKKSGKIRVPTLYDISGGSQWYNAMDIGIVIYRDMETNETTVYIKKVRFRFIGRLGDVQFHFNRLNNRFSEWSEEYGANKKDDDGILEKMRESYMQQAQLNYSIRSLNNYSVDPDRPKEENNDCVI